MNITTEKAAEAKPIIGVDIAKNCFQLAVAEASNFPPRSRRSSMITAFI